MRMHVIASVAWRSSEFSGSPRYARDDRDSKRVSLLEQNMLIIRSDPFLFQGNGADLIMMDTLHYCLTEQSMLIIRSDLTPIKHTLKLSNTALLKLYRR